MLSYEKTILVYGATGLKRADVQSSEDFDNLAFLLENSIVHHMGNFTFTLGNLKIALFS